MPIYPYVVTLPCVDVVQYRLCCASAPLLQLLSSAWQGFDVARSGDGRVAMIGFPSVGKSSLLNELTETESVAAGYEFTTLTCIPGNVSGGVSSLVTCSSTDRHKYACCPTSAYLALLRWSCRGFDVL